MENAAMIVGQRLEQARTNRGQLSRWIGEQGGRIDWVPPRGGVSAFVRFRDLPDVDSFCRRLASELGVLLVPGSCFRQPAHARLGFGCSGSVLTEGLERTARSLRAMSPGSSHETHGERGARA
jgi:aspartate/methionine/tyrosine aminotransferase